MGQLRTRGYQASDASALADLWNLIEQHAGGHPGFTPEDAQSILTAMVRNAGSDSRLVFAPDGALVAAAVTPTPPPGGFRVDLMGGVHPQWRGQGIGRELLSWQLTRAAEIHRTEAPGAAWEAHVGMLIGDEDALRLFRRFGMSPVRYWFEMVAPTAPAPATALPDGLRMITYSPEHEKALHATHSEAFADHWGYQRRDLQEWATLTVGSDSFLPELSLLAFDGDELAGYVLSYTDADPTRLYIGHVGVRRPWRRRGLAGGLLAQVLGAAGRTGRTSAGLGVDADSPTGAVGVYERVGFSVESRAVTYARPLAD